MLFQFLNYHIALILSLNYIQGKNIIMIDRQLPKQPSNPQITIILLNFKNPDIITNLTNPNI